MKKFVLPAKPKKIKIGSQAKKKAEARRKIEMLEEQREFDAKTDLIDVLSEPFKGTDQE